MEMSRLMTRNGTTAEPVSRNQILRREQRGQGNINFPCLIQLTTARAGLATLHGRCIPLQDMCDQHTYIQYNSTIYKTKTIRSTRINMLNKTSSGFVGSLGAAFDHHGSLGNKMCGPR